MVAKINLLPWREEFRQEKKKEFVRISVGVLVLGLAFVGLWDRVVNGQMDNQRSRNQVLESKISELEVKVKEIEELKERRQQLLNRMTVIQALQSNRPEIVKVFDELTSAVPEGVFLSGLERVGSEISLTGYAESNNRVSAFMRNLESSYKFTDPNLTKVLADDELGEQGNTFDMRVKISEPEVLEQQSANVSGSAG
jgi:type IV pilus assembly protein PilN